MKQTLTKFLMLMALGLVVFTYQNCGPEMGGEAGQTSQSNAPFAYSVTADRIAYMSCTDTTNVQDFFTLKLGAYDTSRTGVTLRSPFRSLIYSYPLSRKVEILNENAINRAAQIQVALRPLTDLVGITTINGKPVFQNVLTPLNLSPVAPDLVSLASGQYLPDSKFPLRGNLQVGIANDENFRDQLTSKQIMLTMTFLEEGQKNFSRTVNSKVPGTGYHVALDCLGGLSPDMHILCGVEEYDLETDTVVGNWDCPTQYHFKIVRNGEAATAGCDFSNPPTGNPVWIEAGKILGSAWRIDINHRCIMPATTSVGSCYGSGVIDYGLSACGQPGQPICARHFSLCIKDN
jgi:hypothetical protein